MKKDRNYKVCVFGRSLKGMPKEDCIDRSSLYHTRFDAIVLCSLRDVMYVKTYRLFNRDNPGTKYIYVDKCGLASALMAGKTRKMLPARLIEWNLFLNLSSWLDHYIATSPEEKRLAEEHFDGVGTKVHMASGQGSSQLAAACRHIISRS